MRGATHRLPGLVLTEHEFEVPLDHADPGGEQITLFAREVVAPRKRDQDLPWLLFLQGGPGGTATRPLAGRAGWAGRCPTTGCCCSTSAAPAAPRPPTRQTLAGPRGARGRRRAT